MLLRKNLRDPILLIFIRVVCSVSVKGETRSKLRNFGDFLCYPQSADVKTYAEGK